MADAAAPAPAKKIVKAKKAAAPKKPAAHPKYTEMIAAAITSLKDRKGSSGSAIKKYIVANYKVDEKSVGPHVRVALKRGVAAGDLKQVKGTGASGSFKNAEKAAKPKKAAKKPAAKKAAKSPKKAAKKPAAKKAAKSPKKATKKPAAAKKAAKSPAKKPAAKKAKKPAAKKAPAKK